MQFKFGWSPSTVSLPRQSSRHCHSVHLRSCVCNADWPRPVNKQLSTLNFILVKVEEVAGSKIW